MKLPQDNPAEFDHESADNMKQRLAIFVMACLAACILSLTLVASANAESLFTVTGKGWGHGIGLSQYGAKGYAEHGWTYDAILAHYYQQTTLGTVSKKTLAVNLDASKAFRSSWTLRPGIPGDSLVVGGIGFGSDAALRFVASGTSINVYDSSTGALWKSFASPVAVTSSGTALVQVVDASGPFSRTYVAWRGSMKLTAASSALKLVNNVTMEDYLRGVVPRESPASWPAEALKAQAVAARSYAYTSTRAELYCTTMDQVYGGYGRDSNRRYPVASSDPRLYEDSRTDAAVVATQNQVVKYGSVIVQTFFYSTSGGYTANKEDIWGGDHYAYWSAVPDIYENSPYTDSWGDPLYYTGSELAAELGYSGTVRAVSVVRGTGDWVKSATIVFADGSSTTITGDVFRSKLGLKSAKFWVRSTEPPVRFEQDDPRTDYTGTWTAVSSSLSSSTSYVQASASGAMISVPFVGTEIAWVARTGPDCGQAEILLDGVSQGMVSLYDASDHLQKVVWTKAGLPNAQHTLVIRVLGAKDAASVGTAVSVDAFDIVGSLKETAAVRFEHDDSRLAYLSAWSAGALWQMSSGDYAYTKTAGASVTVPFYGTGIAVVAPTYTTYGTAQVFLDGVAAGTIDLESDHTRYQQQVWSISGLSRGDHVLKLVATATDGSFLFDAVDVFDGSVRSAGYTRIEEDSSAVRPISGWKTSSSSGLSAGTYAYTKTAGSQLDVAFEGTAIDGIGLQWLSFGKAEVYVDGTRYGDLVDYYDSTGQYQRRVFGISGLANGMHRVSIKATGTASTSSLGIAICADAFDVLGKPAAIIDQSDGNIKYSGTWSTGSSPTLSGGTIQYSKIAGSKITIAFQGSGISLIGVKGSAYGRARVYLDGIAQGEISLYSAKTQYRRSLWSASGLDANASHTVTIEVVGTGWVGLDAVDVAGFLMNPSDVAVPGMTLYQETDSKIAFSSGWQTWTSSVLSGGTMKYTTTDGATAAVQFSGTGITLISNRTPTYGELRVTVDDGAPVLVSLYSPSTKYRQSVFSVAGLTDGTHTVLIESVGIRTVALDAVAVSGELLAAALDSGDAIPGAGTTLRVEDSDAALLYTPEWASWPSPLLSGGGVHYTSTAGARCYIEFEGTTVGLLSSYTRSYGTFKVYLDDMAPVTVSLRRSATSYQQLVYSVGGLADGGHSLVVEAIGDGAVAIDAVDIDGSIVAAEGPMIFDGLEESSDSLVYAGTWLPWSSTVLSSGAQAYSVSASDSVSIRTDALRVRLVSNYTKTYGTVDVYMDGVKVDSVSLRRATTMYQQVVWDSGPLTNAEHEVAFVVVGDGTVAVDRIDIARP